MSHEIAMQQQGLFSLAMMSFSKRSETVGAKKWKRKIQCQKHSFLAGKVDFWQEIGSIDFGRLIMASCCVVFSNGS